MDKSNAVGWVEEDYIVVLAKQHMEKCNKIGDRFKRCGVDETRDSETRAPSCTQASKQASTNKINGADLVSSTEPALRNLDIHPGGTA